MRAATRSLGSLVLVLAGVTCAVALVSDLPDSTLNPQDGRIQIVDLVRKTDNWDVRFVARPALGSSAAEPEVSMVSSHAFDDLGPRIAVEADGDTWVVWWREGTVRQVVARKRAYSGGVWSSEEIVSDPEEASANPSIVSDGEVIFVAFEIEDGSATGIAVNVINDEPDPIGIREVLTSTGHGGEIDVRAHATGGKIWVTWVDDETTVGWSLYDKASGEWSGVGYEPCAGDDVDSARERIQADVLGGD
jgi:hypothetical protein